MRRHEKFVNETGIPCRLFTGIVEDNNDPKDRGRVRVRIHNIHSEIKTETSTKGIKTEHLPWCNPIMPPSGGGITGRGKWYDAPEQGSLLLCFAMDYLEFQKFYYFGCIADGRRIESNVNIGFNDPSGLWPRTDRIKNDINVPSTGDAPFTKSQIRKTFGLTYFDILSQDIEEDNNEYIIGAFGNDRWKEKGPSSLPIGKFNSVEESHPRDYMDENIHYKIGHVKEVDSTPHNEGIREYYAPSGSYKQIDGSGEEKLRLKGGREHVIFAKDRLQVKGFQSLVVEGDQYVLVLKDKFQEILGKLNERMDSMEQEIIGIKKVAADKIINETNTHKLDSDSNTRPINNYQICPFSGASHSTQNKTFCSP